MPGTSLYGPRPQHRKHSQHLSHDLRCPATLLRCDAAGLSVQLRCVDENAARSSAYPLKKHQKPQAQCHSPHPVGLGARPNTSTISIVQCPTFCLCDFCDVHNIYLSIYRSIYLSIYFRFVYILSVYFFISYLSIYTVRANLPIYLPIYLPIHLFSYLAVYLPIYLSIYLSIS